MKIRRSVVFVAVLCTSVLTSIARSEQVVVHVSGIKKLTGKIFIALCDESDFKKRDCPKRTIKEAEPSEVNVTFENIPQGRYAVMVFQDLNGNGDLDHFLFIPREPWGVSLGSRGVPAFSKSAFDVSKDYTVDVTIE